MRLVYITLARKNLCYGSFPAKVSLGTNAYNSLLKYLRDNFRLVVNLLFENGQKQHYIQGVFPGAVFWLC